VQGGARLVAEAEQQDLPVRRVELAHW
jgi:hypothetical protein